MSRNLSRQEIIREVEIMGEDVAEKLGYELVEVDYKKIKGDYILSIFIYSESGISTKDCEIMSRKLSEEIDKKDPIPGAYLLEVSSPGLDRPISTDKDLKRNMKKDVEVRLYKALDKRKQLEGKLIGYDDDKVILLEDGDVEIEIPRDIISLMKLVIKI